MSSPSLAVEVHDTAFKRLLMGESRLRTRRTLLLAIVSFFGVAGLNLAVPSYFPAEIPWAFDGFRHAFVLNITFSEPVAFGPAVVVIAGLAGIAANLNEDYVPSLVLTTAPVHSDYTFTLPGPVLVLVVRINDD